MSAPSPRGKRKHAPRRRTLRVTDPLEMQLVLAIRQLDRLARHEVDELIHRFDTRRQNAEAWGCDGGARSEEAERDAFASAVEELRQRWAARVKGGSADDGCEREHHGR
jgi:hypothetical protein